MSNLFVKATSAVTVEKDALHCKSKRVLHFVLAAIELNLAVVGTVRTEKGYMWLEGFFPSLTLLVDLTMSLQLLTIHVVSNGHKYSS